MYMGNRKDTVAAMVDSGHSATGTNLRNSAHRVKQLHHSYGVDDIRRLVATTTLFTMVSLMRTLKHARQAGFKEWFRMLR